MNGRFQNLYQQLNEIKKVADYKKIKELELIFCHNKDITSHK